MTDLDCPPIHEEDQMEDEALDQRASGLRFLSAITGVTSNIDRG